MLELASNESHRVRDSKLSCISIPALRPRVLKSQVSTTTLDAVTLYGAANHHPRAITASTANMSIDPYAMIHERHCISHTVPPSARSMIIMLMVQRPDSRACIDFTSGALEQPSVRTECTFVLPSHSALKMFGICGESLARAGFLKKPGPQRLAQPSSFR